MKARSTPTIEALRLWIAIPVLMLALCPGCEGLDLGKWINRGKKAADTARKIKRATDAAHLTPKQEHYVGRAVSARILQQYKPYNNPAANRYLNVLGQTLAQASDRPETYKGYRFLILDTDEVNALSAPGGFVFVTRGLLRCCQSEGALAGILAHEIAHVQYRHGLRSIRTKRLTEVGALLLGEAAAEAGSGDFKKLVGAFEGSIDDVADTLINSKYSRATEVRADQMAVVILQRIGYDPEAFVGALEAMSQRFQADKRGFAKTHPDPAYRIRVIRKQAAAGEADAEPISPSSKRAARFAEATKGV